MASVVCQGLQTCLIESTVLTHKPSSKPTQMHQKAKLESNPLMDNNGERINKNNGWSFLGVLENPSSKNVKIEEVYVHPMVKKSASALSTKSLEMCTESLGTESGSDVSDSSDELGGDQWKPKARIFDRKTVISSRKSGFPPPLTSISGGSDGTVKVKPHREGGRLVIKAVSVSDCGAKFEADRTNGRLRLSLKDCGINYESGGVEMKNEGGEDMSYSDDEDVEEDGGGGWWDMDGNKGKVRGKTGTDKFKRRTRFPNSFEDLTEFGLTRCKEGGNKNKGITNWSSLRVVIS